MGLLDYYEDLRRDAEVQGKEGSKDLWTKAAAAALVIASRKVSKRRLASWTREAVECMIHASPESEEVLEDLLWHSPHRSFDEAWKAFEDRYGDPFGYVPTF